jgi:hypothetical protein
MVKATKFFKKQAERAQRRALATTDTEASENFSSLALAYRSQADALKKSQKKSDKKEKPKAKK